MATSSVPSDLPQVRTHHLLAALGVSISSFNIMFAAGRIPPPDSRGAGNAKIWRLETIRAWNPQVGDAVEVLLNHPVFPVAALARAA